MKKSRYLKVTAFLLACCILLSTAAFAETLGDTVDGWSTSVGKGVQLRRSVIWTGSDMRTETYLEYAPNDTVYPIVVYGSRVCNYGNFKSMASVAESAGVHVIAGINGDYYNTSSYEPLGIVVTDGVLRSSDGGHWALGFKADGRAVIGRPEMSFSVTIAGDTYPVASVNKERTQTDFALFTSDYSRTDRATTPGRSVIMSAAGGAELAVNCVLDLTVEEIVENDGVMTLPEGKYVLSLADSADEWRGNAVSALEIGDTVTFTSSADEMWNDVVWAVGSLYKLVTDGKAESGLEAAAAPRTAVGIREDGNIIFYTVDGRQSGYSIGASMTQTAQRLIELGCTEACIMDGGGSTSLNAVYLGDEAASLINSPSGGTQRSVTNYIMLVTDAEPVGKADVLVSYPLSSRVLKGAHVSFTAKAADSAGFAAPLPSGTVWSVSGGTGSINAQGVFTAQKAGDGSVCASAPGLKSAQSAVRVVETPDDITVKDESGGKTVTALEIEIGQSVSLTACAVQNHVALVSEDVCYVWSVRGDIGEIDEEGTFIAAERPGTGEITVSAGGKTVSVPVTVKYPTGYWENPFEDVSEENWFYDGAKYVCQRGLFTGVTDVSFEPETEMTRGMLVTVFWRMEGSPDQESVSAFTDVSADAWFAQAVTWANSQGLVTGVTDVSFEPNEPITREQLAVFLHRYAGMKEYAVTSDKNALDGFSDKSKVSGYAVDSMCWAADHGLIGGVTETELMPQNGASRAQVAVLLKRFAEKFE